MIYSGGGNRFLITDRLRVICPESLDGVLVLEKSEVADVKMRIFNRDGTEAEMCGNGLRCVAAHLGKGESLIESASGVHRCGKEGDLYWTELHVSPVEKVERDGVQFFSVNTGVPHWVVFSEEIFSQKCAEICARENVNVDLVLNHHVRTFERGVGETLACGTGIVACHMALQYVGKVGNTAELFAKSGMQFFSKIDGDRAILYGSVECETDSCCDTAAKGVAGEVAGRLSTEFGVKSK